MDVDFHFLSNAKPSISPHGRTFFCLNLETRLRRTSWDRLIRNRLIYDRLYGTGFVLAYKNKGYARRFRKLYDKNPLSEHIDFFRISMFSNFLLFSTTDCKFPQKSELKIYFCNVIRKTKQIKLSKRKQ